MRKEGNAGIDIEPPWQMGSKGITDMDAMENICVDIVVQGVETFGAVVSAWSKHSITVDCRVAVN